MVVRIDPRYFARRGGYALVIPQSYEKLGWTPTTTLEELVSEMVAVDEEAQKDATSSAMVLKDSAREFN